MLLQNKALGIRNLVMQKPGFPKMCHYVKQYVGFLQIGSHVATFLQKCNYYLVSFFDPHSTTYYSFVTPLKIILYQNQDKITLHTLHIYTHYIHSYVHYVTYHSHPV